MQAWGLALHLTSWPLRPCDPPRPQRETRAWLLERRRPLTEREQVLYRLAEADAAVVGQELPELKRQIWAIGRTDRNGRLRHTRDFPLTPVPSFTATHVVLDNDTVKVRSHRIACRKA